MSATVWTRPLPCEKCKVAGTFEAYAPFPAGQELNYVTAWACPTCKRRVADVCPIGPAIPTGTSCLNCGIDIDPAPSCSGCGMTDPEAIEFLGARTSGSVLDEARGDISAGLARRGLARLNLHLRGDPASVDAWRMKAVFYQR